MNNTLWHVEPDQPSHGRALCIVAADGQVIARTPTVDAYGCPEQAQDEANATLIAHVIPIAALLDRVQNYCPVFVQDEIRALLREAGYRE